MQVGVHFRGFLPGFDRHSPPQLGIICQSKQLALPGPLPGLAGRLAAQRGGLQELLVALRVAHACRFAAAQYSCLEGLADHIAAAGSCWPPGLAEALEGFDSLVLTQLLRKTGLRSLGSIYRPSLLFDLRPEATGGATGGFTYCLEAFSTQHGTEPGGIFSPWADVGGFRWRLNVHPKGKDDAKGIHLAGKRLTVGQDLGPPKGCPLSGDLRGHGAGQGCGDSPSNLPEPSSQLCT